MKNINGPLKVGIGGPVGAGKTSLTAELCKFLSKKISMAVISNDIYTKEDAEFLMKAQALPLERIKGVETGGCPHTAIREDASINMLAVENMKKKFPDLDLILIESGGDNLAATFSPELVDLSIYVIDVGMGGDIPRKGGPAIQKSDLFFLRQQVHLFQLLMVHLYFSCFINPCFQIFMLDTVDVTIKANST